MLDVRVVALATNIPGPLAAEDLAGAGASVVKVEPPQGDPLEGAAPQWYGRVISGMQRLRLDLKDPQARAQFEGMLEACDVFITTLRPRALERLGLDPEGVAGRYPRMCHVAVVGEAGANADHAGHDLTYQARAGLLTPPSVPRVVIADMFAAQRAVSAVYELLYLRERSGAGGFREVAIAEGAVSLNDAHRFGLTGSGPLGGGSPLYRIYQSADGWIALAALEPHFQAALRAALGIELGERELSAAFVRQPNAHWETLARAHDLPLAALA